MKLIHVQVSAPADDNFGADYLFPCGDQPTQQVVRKAIELLDETASQVKAGTHPLLVAYASESKNLF